MRISDGQKISLAFMVTALELVVLFAAGMFGYAGYALMLFSSVFVYVLTCEGLFVHAFVTYIAVSIISFLIVPDKTTAIAFAGLLGHYPMFKEITDRKIGSKTAAFCVKMLYCNVIAILALCLVIFVFGISVPTDLPIPKWLAVIIVEAAFIVNELIHSFCRWLYTEKFRSGIVPKN